VRHLQLSLLVALMHASTIQAQVVASASVTTPEVVALGRGEVRIRPDRATLVVAVVTRAATAAQAGRMNAEQVGPVLAALRRLALPDSALSTSGYTVELEASEPYQPAAVGRPRKYVARNAVRIAVPRLELLGMIVDTALAAGATDAGEITLESSQTSEGRRRAIAIATLDARAEAAAAAAALGGTLGAMIEVVVDPNGGRFFGGQSFNLQNVVVSNGRSGPPPTVLLPSEVTITVQVRVRAALSLAAR
jgi:uncharacterized protein YggE